MEAAGDMGFVFGMLLRHREIYGNPPTRPLRSDELRAAKILSQWTQFQLDEFEDFLNAQGLTLIVKDGFAYGIPPKLSVPNFIYILSRQRGGELAPYLDKRWFLAAATDNRFRKKDDNIFWVARLWLTLQWFFYQKKDRMPGDVSGYRDAFVSESLFVETLVAGIEKMINAGRPKGEQGVMWDALNQDSKQIRTRAANFLRVMLEAGMIDDTGNEGEYRQTLGAAIEMAEMAEQELAYLMPADKDDLERATVALLTGIPASTETVSANPEADHAAD